MAFVVDASVTLAWCFEERLTAPADRILDRVTRDEAVVPAIWPLEVSNGLLVALRARRTTAAHIERLIGLLSALPISMDPLPAKKAFDSVLPLAREHRLSAYDAAYLELALRRGISLATFDNALRRAALATGVSVL